MRFLSRLPKQCHVCGFTIDRSLGHNLWCEYCQPLFNFERHRCTRCGLTMDNTAEICGACLTTPPPWQTLTCLGDYRPPLSSFIQRIKQHREPWLLPPLSKLLAERISEPAPLLICVPTLLHVELKRGFNLSELIMLQLAQHLPEIKTADSIFRKHRQTATQKSLNRQQRMENVRQAFSLQQRPTSKHVAIIDDVVTTGATVRHLSELLLEVNVEKIDIYCLCRTPK